MTLRLVEVSPFVVWPWHLRFLDSALGDEHPRGAPCRGCRQDVAVKRSADPRGATCLYCALDEGLLEPVDVPPCEGSLL